jgi:hypothetical protein
LRATGGRNTYDSSPDFELIFISQFPIFQKYLEFFILEFGMCLISVGVYTAVYQ